MQESLVLKTLEKLSKENIILIGGYAVNAYVPPRFSNDCDLVVLGSSTDIESQLTHEGFDKSEEGDVSYGNYVRFVSSETKVSFDLLVNSVVDRDSRIVFEGELFRKNSAERTTVGRSVPTRIKMLIVNPELLFAMKYVSGRRQDVRDIFMLAGAELDWKVVSELVSSKCDIELIKTRARSIAASIGSMNYRDSLQGPYGKMPDKKFDTCKKNISRFFDEISAPEVFQPAHVNKRPAWFLF